MIQRIVVAGGPRVGKTTLANSVGERSGLVVRHTDDLALMGWSEASAAASHWFDSPGRWAVEGVATVRALRKWLLRERFGKPCDVVVWLETPRVRLTHGQDALAKGCATVWHDVAPALRDRGVRIVTETDASALTDVAAFGIKELAATERRLS